MVDVAKTQIATSDPLNICNGLALFPVGTVRAGVSVSGNTGSLFNADFDTFFRWRISANAGYEIFVGLCGPAYAVKMELEGTALNQNLDLTVSNEEVAAGVFFGWNVRFYINLIIDAVESYVVWDGWNTHLDEHWNRLVNSKLDINLDVIGITLTFIRMALSQDSGAKAVLEKVNTFTPSLLGSYGMYDDRANTLVSNAGKTTVRPTFNVPINLASLVPQLKAFNESLKPFLSGVSFGVLIGFQIPVTVEMKYVKLDSITYTGLTFDSVNKIVKGTTIGVAPAAPSAIKVGFDHSPGFDFTLGLFANVNLIKCFNLGINISFPILSFLGLVPMAGPFSNELSNTIGSMAAKNCGCGPGTGTELVEVVFEEPEGIAV